MLIAARESFAAAAARKPTARDYVQDGLVAMWDGIENAGWGVHNASATTWVDLSGNGYNLSVRAASAWEDYGIRAVGNYVAKTSNVISRQLNVYGEVCVDASAGNGTGSFFWNDTDFGQKGEQRFLAQDTGAAVPFLSTGYLVANFAVVRNINGTFQINWGSRGCAYNGSALADTAGAYNPGAYSGEMVIGGRSAYNGSYGFYCVNALIRSIRIYSRVPTAAEKAVNFKIDRERFNLP